MDGKPLGSNALAQSREIIGGLMDPREQDFGYWSPSDLRSVLEHQLRTPLRLELEAILRHASASEGDARHLIEAGPYVTFRDVLERGSADDDALRLVKEYAKSERLSPDGLPKDVAHFIYVASVVRARAAGASGLSSLDPASIESEARRCLTLHWLPDEARDLLRRGLAG